ncbi:MAG TPA: hypothetical protein DIC34_08010 [Treponema sp.]|nr:MAG: hypothetical protein A2001_00450 [Treponema sp. GWC1_61_84]HCM26469.1 hypothetical protein [Treponema sp.]
MKHFQAVFFGFLVTFVVVSAYSETITLNTISQTGYVSKYNAGDTERPGICIEIIREMGKIDPELKITGLEKQAATARIESMLDEKAIDIFFGLAKSSARETKYLFVEPELYSSSQCLFIRSDDNIDIKTFDDVKKLGKDGSVLVIAGSIQETYLKSVGGLVIDAGSTDTILNLNKLISGRGRFYYGSDFNTMEGISGQGLGSKVKALPVRFQPIGIYAAFPKNADAKIVKRVQVNLKKLNDLGILKALYKKYSE